jgi:hypothetical protein
VFALAAAVMFLIAVIKQGHADTALFWVYLGLMLWALHFFVDPFLTPYYPSRRTTPQQRV